MLGGVRLRSETVWVRVPSVVPIGMKTKQYTRYSKRRYNHINKCENVFIPQWRMREIRWEEAVAYSRLKRAPKPNGRLIHFTCHCGSVGCLGVPIIL